MTVVTPLISWMAKLWLPAALSNTSPVVTLGDFSVHTDNPLPLLWASQFTDFILFYTLPYPRFITRTCHYPKLQSHHNQPLAPNLSIKSLAPPRLTIPLSPRDLQSINPFPFPLFLALNIHTFISFLTQQRYHTVHHYNHSLVLNPLASLLLGHIWENF